MSTTVFDALQNAQANFEPVGKLGAKNNPIFMIAMDQLNNAIAAVNNNKSLDYVIKEHIFGEVDTGP